MEAFNILAAKNYTNNALCGRCAGRCCQDLPGAAWPEQFGAPDRDKLLSGIVQLLGSGKWSVDRWDGWEGEGGGQFIRPATTKSKTVIDYSYGGRCIFLGASGCTLSHGERPIVCRLLVPNEMFPACTFTDLSDNGKYDSARAWEPYHQEISKALTVLGISEPATGEDDWLAGLLVGTVPMSRSSWRSQLAAGRVFELRSKSTRYPAPCALVLDTDHTKYGRAQVIEVDRRGVRGNDYYWRPANPGIYVNGLRGKNFTKRIRRRRQDLERFDADDLALIKEGFSLAFNGCISGSYSDMHIPMVAPSAWTVFWLRAFDSDDFRIYDFWHHKMLLSLLSGAWHFNSHGGSRHLGYKFGHAWATRHVGSRLRDIREFMRSHIGGIIEQEVKVVRWAEGGNVYTEEIRRDCPALGSRWCHIQTPQGTHRIWR